MIACDVSVGGKKGTQRSVSLYYVLTSLDGVTFNPVLNSGGGEKVCLSHKGYVTKLFFFLSSY